MPRAPLFDSSSDDEMPLQDLKFVQGCAEHSDAVESTRCFARYVRCCRMSEYSLLKQVYACASICGKVTEASAALEDQLRHGSFPYGDPPRNRLFERGPMPGDANVNVIALANQAVDTLRQPLQGVVQEEVPEAPGMQRRRPESRWSTSWGRHSLWTSTGCGPVGFSSCMLPQGRNDDGDMVRNETQPHAMAINHWLNSCPPAIPT